MYVSTLIFDYIDIRLSRFFLKVTFDSFSSSAPSVTVPFHESRLNWVHDPTPPPSRRLEATNTVPISDSSENSSVSIPRNILAPIPSASLHNSSVSVSSPPNPNNSPNMCPSVRKVRMRCPPLPRAAHQQLLSPQLLPRNVG